MTNTPAAGWFNDPQQPGQLRYWDGTTWTEHRAPGSLNPASPPAGTTGARQFPAGPNVGGRGQPEPAPTEAAASLAGSPAPGSATAPVAAPAPLAGLPDGAQRPGGAGAASGGPFYRRTWFIAVVVGVVAFGVGAAAGASGTPDPTSTTEYKALAKELDTTNSDLQQTQDDLTEAQDALGDLPDREDQLEQDQEQLKQDQADLAKREQAVAAAEKAVAKREKAVGLVEQEIKNNTVDGNGMYKVGTDMKPGTYKTAGKNGCYYAVLNSTDTFDIAVNGNPPGPAFATVSAGQYFESDGCADWVLQQ